MKELEVSPSFVVEAKNFFMSDMLASLIADTKQLIFAWGKEGEQLSSKLNELEKISTGFIEYQQAKKQTVKKAITAFSYKSPHTRFNNLPLMLQGLFSLDERHAIAIPELLAVPPVPMIDSEIEKQFAVLFKGYISLLRQNFSYCDLSNDLPDNIRFMLDFDYIDIPKMLVEWETEIERRIRLYEMPKFMISHETHKVTANIRKNCEKIRVWLLEFYAHQKKYVNKSFWHQWKIFDSMQNNETDILYNFTLQDKIRIYLSELHFLVDYTYQAEIISEKVHAKTNDERYLQGCLEHIALIKQHAQELENKYPCDEQYEYMDNCWREIQEIIHVHAYEITSTHALNGFRSLIHEFCSQGITPLGSVFRGEIILWNGYPIEPFKYQDILGNREYLFVMQKTIDIMVVYDHEQGLSYDDLKEHAQALSALLDRVKLELRANKNLHSSTRLMDMVDHLQHKFVVHKRAAAPSILKEFLKEHKQKYGNNKFAERLISEDLQNASILQIVPQDFQLKHVSNDE